MVKCPFCQEEMKRKVLNIVTEPVGNKTIEIKYDDEYTCRMHGVILHPGRSKRVDLDE